jgi:hypothetical protein
MNKIIRIKKDKLSKVLKISIDLSFPILKFPVHPCKCLLSNEHSPKNPRSSVAPLKKGSREMKKFNIIGKTHAEV